jgi:hypothetical protein
MLEEYQTYSDLARHRVQPKADSYDR